MTIEQQVKDRFDRATAATPEADVGAAIARGRRVRRRRRVTAYAAGSVAVAAVTASVVALPRLGDEPRTVAPAGDGPADDGTFVPGTTIDTDLAAVVAAAEPSLPAPRDVYPSDWSRDTPLPDADFADATEWQLVYDLAPGVELLVYVGKPIPGEPVGQAPGTVTSGVHAIGDPTREVWFQSLFVAADGGMVNAIEQVDATAPQQGERRRVLTDAQTRAIAQAPGLDFPDPVSPPPAP